tara:strand:+ start:5271 stop:6824 length:1554 start_codon:yes stop_codon:yes gene_type:complete
VSKTIRLSLGKISGSPQAAQESVSQAGMVGNELAKVGQTIASTGQKLGSLVERRRAEEARATISQESTRNKIESKAEFENLKEQFKDNPLGLTKELSKIQEKRHADTLKGITSEFAKTKLTEDFEISRLENQLTSTSHERVQFTKKGIEQEVRGAEEEAQMDFLYPPSSEEYKVDLANTLDLVNQRDWDDDTKDKVSKSIIKTRTKGVLTGYMEGGQNSDFNRAEKLVSDLTENGLLSSPDAKAWGDKIDNERRRKMNDDIFRESQSIKAAEKAFDNEQWALGGEFTKVAQDPNYDPTATIKSLKTRGVPVPSNFKIVSETKMSDTQKSKSDNIKYSALEELSSTSDIRRVRTIVNKSTMSGALSAEGAQEVLNSALIRTNSKANTKAFSESDSVLKKHATSGNFFDKTTDQELLHDMKIQRDKIVQATGVSPYEASLMTLKEFGKNLPSNKISGLSSDTTTIKGAREALEEIVQKQKDETLDEKKASRMYRRVERMIELMEADKSVTLKEFLGRNK